MEDGLISVLVPLYNVAQYLPECVESILAQTDEHFECLLVDDGSTDGSGQLCDAFARKDSRVRVIHKGNQGVSEARNTCLENARGQYFCFVDSDDWVEPEMLAVLRKAVETYGVQIAEITQCLPGNSGSERVLVTEGQALMLGYYQEKDLGIPGYLGWGPVAKLYDAALWKNFRFPAGKIYEDLLVVSQVLFSAQRVVLMDRPMYHYRIRPGSIMHSELTDDLAEMARQLAEYCDRENIAPDIVFDFCLRHLYGYFCKEIRLGSSVEAPFLRGTRGFIRQYFRRMWKSDALDLVSKVRLTELAVLNSVRLPMRPEGTE